MTTQLFMFLVAAWLIICPWIVSRRPSGGAR